MDKVERQKKHFNEIAEVYYQARLTENHLLKVRNALNCLK